MEPYKKIKLHVCKADDNKWSVILVGYGVLRKYFTQAEAIHEAEFTARQLNAELTIAGENGKIREKNSYGNDPFPPKG